MWRVSGNQSALDLFPGTSVSDSRPVKSDASSTAGLAAPSRRGCWVMGLCVRDGQIEGGRRKALAGFAAFCSMNVTDGPDRFLILKQEELISEQDSQTLYDIILQLWSAAAHS
ncbi:unnamed protein product [Pleuronectes platessa]|uniref:Uncharacterized protein n=1 Tax=Pleuronectes platessa TaxID=8262 RepID=A0A9N7TYP7_PLEPL|nr:unnamed protein product [Pleuronectes platessa]